MTRFVYTFSALIFWLPHKAYAAAQGMRFCPGSHGHEQIVVASGEFQKLITTLCWVTGFIILMRIVWIAYRGRKDPPSVPVAADPLDKRDTAIFCAIGLFLILLPETVPGAAQDGAGLTGFAVVLCWLAGFAALVRGLVLASRVWKAWKEESVWKRVALHAIAALALISFPFIQSVMQRSVENGPMVMPPADNIAALTADDGLALHYNLPREPKNAEDAAQLGQLYQAGLAVPQNDAEALRWYRLAALEGNAPAQRSLAEMYYNGQGVPQDFAQAFRWYLAAATQGDIDAQLVLSTIYSKGQGVKADDAQAYFWNQLWRRNSGDKNPLYQDWPLTHDQRAAADQRVKDWKPQPGTDALRAKAEKGNAAAQLELGLIYARGQGVPAESAEALKWMRKAAEQGVPRAQSFLGYLYESGKGVTADYGEAYFWYKLASQKPADDAIRVPMGRSDLAALLTQDQKNAADARIAAWKPKKNGGAK